MTEAQVPRMCEIMTPAVDALAAGVDASARGARIYQANHGRWGDILRGWRGQGEVVRARLTKEIIATRLLEQNSGQALRDLAASEYSASLVDAPQYAVGEVILIRHKTNGSSGSTGNFTSGVIKAGTRISRPRVVEGSVPLPDASFTVSEDTVCGTDDNTAPVDAGGGDWTHTQAVFAPIVASRSGTDANTPVSSAGQLDERIFDAGAPAAERFAVADLTSAGGAVGITDPQLRRFAKAMGVGRQGANNAAAIAGALQDPRVCRVAAALDYRTAILQLYVADASWATSAKFRALVLQGISDRTWRGFGARLAIGRVFNQPITVEATVVLRSALDQGELTALTTSTRSKLQIYFDERADFYSWRTNAIGAVVATADKRILTCSGSPVVRAFGSALTQPAARIPSGAIEVTHYLLTGVNLNFVTPGG